MRTQGTPPRQAYNAQATVNDQQVILAAEITIAAPDFGQLEPMFEATMRQLAEQGMTETPEVVLADAGFWHHPQMQTIEEQGIEVLVPPDGNMREGKRRGWEEGVYRADARQAEHRSRPQALRPAEDHDRAGIRADQIQPAHRPVHAKRQIGRPVRVAASHSDPQPAQAPQPLDRHPGLTPRVADPRAPSYRSTDAARKISFLARCAFSDGLATWRSSESCRSSTE